MRMVRALSMIGSVAIVLVASSEARAEKADKKVADKQVASIASKAACVQAHDRAQASSHERQLKSAREDFLECAKDLCPAVLREDCSRSLTEIDAAIPSIVFSASAETGDVSNVRVLVDGVVATEQIDGRARDVDPGPHVVRFERAGSAPIEIRVVAREGDKNRVVSASYAPAKLFGPIEPPRKERAGGVPVLPIIIGGVGLAAIGGGAYLRVRTDASAAEMQRSCAPMCDPGARDSLSDRIAISNVSIAVGLGMLGVSALVWLFDPHRREVP